MEIKRSCYSIIVAFLLIFSSFFEAIANIDHFSSVRFQASADCFLPQFREKPLFDESLPLHFSIYQLSIGANYAIKPFLSASLLLDGFYGSGSDIHIQQAYYDFHSNAKRDGVYLSPGMVLFPFQTPRVFVALEAYTKVGWAHEFIQGYTYHEATRVELFSSDYSGYSWAFCPKLSIGLNVSAINSIALDIGYQYSRYFWDENWDYSTGKHFDKPYYNLSGETPTDLGCGLSIGIKYLFCINKNRIHK
jgi:hypothetical protein